MEYNEENIIGLYFSTNRHGKTPDYYIIQGTKEDHISLCRVGETEPFSTNHDSKKAVVTNFKNEGWYVKDSPEPNYEIY